MKTNLTKYLRIARDRLFVFLFMLIYLGGGEIGLLTRLRIAVREALRG